jgi:FKBP-type peptidyl-prolyl cis-trans isomerase 2
LPAIIGSKFLIKGLEEALRGMKVGEKKHLSLKPEEAFGERSEKLIKLIPEAEFKKQDMVPYQGMLVNIKNLKGRVLSVSGGRVKIDFNHPLAGKELEYDVEIKEQIKKDEDKIKSILELLSKPTGKEEVKISNNIAEIKIDPSLDIPTRVKEEMARLISKWVENFTKIRFIEEYSPTMTDNIQKNKNPEKKK